MARLERLEPGEEALFNDVGAEAAHCSQVSIWLLSVYTYNIYIHIPTYTHVHIYIYTLKHMYVYTYTCTCTYTHIHIHTYTYTFTHAFTHAYTRAYICTFTYVVIPHDPCDALLSHCKHNLLHAAFSEVPKKQ